MTLYNLLELRRTTNGQLLGGWQRYCQEFKIPYYSPTPSRLQDFWSWLCRERPEVIREWFARLDALEEVEK